MPKTRLFISSVQAEFASERQVLDSCRLADPENEVVKRMGMFKERSPEILKVILES